MQHMLYIFNKRFVSILHTNSDFSFGMSKDFTTINGFAMAQTATHNFDVYQPRNPKASAYYKCIENHFEQLERAWMACMHHGMDSGGHMS